MVLDKSSGSSLGITVGPSLDVTSIDADGLVASWNAANVGKEVKLGHRIVQVNGKTDAAEILEKIKAQEVLEIKLAREAPSELGDTDGDKESTMPSPTSTGARAAQAWAVDVASEETPPPQIRNLKNKFDASSEHTGTDGKDGDLVELPSPSTHTSLLTHSLLSPHNAASPPVQLPSPQTGPTPRSHLMTKSMLSPSDRAAAEAVRDSSRTSKLSPGDLVALRELAVEAASAKPAAPPGLAAQASPEAARSLSSMSGMSEVGPAVPDSVSPNLISGPSPLVGGDSTGKVRVAAPARRAATPPDDNEGRDIAPVHSSLSTTSPSLHQTLRQDVENSRAAGYEGLFSGMPIGSVGESTELRDPLRTHGTGSTTGSVGFLGAGPFWTCGSTPHTRGARQRGGGAPASGTEAVVSGFIRGGAPQAAAAMAGPIDLSGRISGLIGNCINLLSTAIDVSDEPEPPEDELTTVLLETKEQRLQWRDFLSEAVSKCRANTLYNSFDVEADPPKYARPPLSTEPKVDAMARNYRQNGSTPPHIVAPHGAGWSHGNPLAISNAATGSGQAWTFRGDQRTEADAAAAVAGDAPGANTTSSSSAPSRPAATAVSGAGDGSASGGGNGIEPDVGVVAGMALGSPGPAQASASASSCPAKTPAKEDASGAPLEEGSRCGMESAEQQEAGGCDLDTGVGLSPGLVDSGLLNAGSSEPSGADAAPAASEPPSNVGISATSRDPPTISVDEAPGPANSVGCLSQVSHNKTPCYASQAAATASPSASVGSSPPPAG